MERFATHVCLVSEQAVPNLLPVLDEDWRPRRVVLAVSPQMTQRANELETVLKTKCAGLEVARLALSDAYDYAALSEAFVGFLAENEGDEVALNVTGGTKLMAVAAQEAFLADQRKVFYVNVSTDEVVTLGERAPSPPLVGKLKVRDLLECHGYRVEQQDRPETDRTRRDLAARLIDHVGSDGVGLGLLNRLAASDAARRQLVATQSDRDLDSKSLDTVIELFGDAGQLTRRGRELVFPNEQARKFVNGGWLELHAYQVLQDLRGMHSGITDVVCGVTLLHPDGKTRNELDVSFLYRNTLHIIECKTANLAQEGHGGDDKATETLYKAEALLKIGGLRTRSMVLDYRGALSSPANVDRAKSAGIVVAAKQQLRDLKGLVSRVWLIRDR